MIFRLIIPIAAFKISDGDIVNASISWSIHPSVLQSPRKPLGGM